MQTCCQMFIIYACRIYALIALYMELTGILVSGGVRWGEGAGGGHKGAQADHHGYMCPGIRGMPVFS